MSRYIADDMRQMVAERANFRCEYCYLPEIHAFFSFHIDHIIPLKHGGLTTIDNLAYACMYCNRNKGTDISSILLPDRTIIRFFNPRIDNWSDHFRLENAWIRPLTNIGAVTAKILDFNYFERVEERQILIDSGRF